MRGRRAATMMAEPLARALFCLTPWAHVITDEGRYATGRDTGQDGRPDDAAVEHAPGDAIVGLGRYRKFFTNGFYGIVVLGALLRLVRLLLRRQHVPSLVGTLRRMFNRIRKACEGIVLLEWAWGLRKMFYAVIT